MQYSNWLYICLNIKLHQCLQHFPEFPIKCFFHSQLSDLWYCTLSLIVLFYAINKMLTLRNKNLWPVLLNIKIDMVWLGMLNSFFFGFCSCLWNTVSYSSLLLQSISETKTKFFNFVRDAQTRTSAKNHGKKINQRKTQVCSSLCCWWLLVRFMLSQLENKYMKVEFHLKSFFVFF